MIGLGAFFTALSMRSRRVDECVATAFKRCHATGDTFWLDVTLGRARTIIIENKIGSFSKHSMTGDTFHGKLAALCGDGRLAPTVSATNYDAFLRRAGVGGHE
jgi:hypothetical protein